jgi:hypothetical protein
MPENWPCDLTRAPSRRADRLVRPAAAAVQLRRGEAASGQEFLDVAAAERETQTGPERVADHVGLETYVHMKWVSFPTPLSLPAAVGIAVTMPVSEQADWCLSRPAR